MLGYQICQSRGIWIKLRRIEFMFPVQFMRTEVILLHWQIHFSDSFLEQLFYRTPPVIAFAISAITSSVFWGFFEFLVKLIRSNHILSHNRSSTFKSSRQRFSVKKGVLKNFAKFTGKHLFWSLFLNKVATWGVQLY